MDNAGDRRYRKIRATTGAPKCRTNTGHEYRRARTIWNVLKSVTRRHTGTDNLHRVATVSILEIEAAGAHRRKQDGAIGPGIQSAGNLRVGWRAEKLQIGSRSSSCGQRSADTLLGVC